MKLHQNDVVTVQMGATVASNVFKVDTDEGPTALLTHPLMPGHVLIRVDKSLINTVVSNLKDSTERCIDYANMNKDLLDYNTLGDIQSISILFALRRNLTPRQKQILANICGVIASIKCNGNLTEAMSLVMKNSSILDEFNLMWFNNFKSLFTGKQPITSKKQRTAIFNIAGYVLAELENPTTPSRK